MFDIVIPVCGDIVVHLNGKPSAIGLDMTLRTAWLDLQNDGLDAKFYVVDNGNPESGELRDALNSCFAEWREKLNLTVIHEKNGSSPQGARNIGANAGTGDLIFFFDHHCNVAPGYFRQMLVTFEQFGAHQVHGAIHSEAYPDAGLFHYEDNRYQGFLGGFKNRPLRDSPYRCVTAPHGSFAIRRDAWKTVGGLLWDGLQGFGGEEHYLGWKLALFGFQTWLNPNASHWHAVNTPATYKNPEAYLSGYLLNHVCAAYVVGGEDVAWEVADRLQDYQLVKMSLNGLTGLRRIPPSHLYDAAVERSEAHAKWIAANQKHTFQELRNQFKKEGTPC